MSADPMMAVLRANPFMFWFAIAAPAAVALFFGYRTMDSVGLETTQQNGTVVDKKFYPRGEAPVVTIAGGRPWIQRQETAEIYLITLAIDGANQYAVVTKPQFDALKPGDPITASLQRTRMSGATYVVGVRAKAL